MRLIATTVVRESLRGKQTTGFIYDVDWDARRILARLPVPEPRFPESDDNPRGGVRGGRGVAATRHGIVVANYDTLYRYDDSWEVLDGFSHPLFVGTHEIDWDGSALWTAATGIDAVLKVSLDGRAEVAWDPHAPGVADRLGLRRRAHPVDGTVDYRIRQAPLIDQCHINGVTRRAGTLVVNCGLVRTRKPLPLRIATRTRNLRLSARRKHDRRRSRRSMVVAVDERGFAEVLLDLGGHDFPTHNGQLLDDSRLALNDSSENSLRVFALEGPHELTRVQVPGTWLRGLEPVDSSRVFVGTAPAAIVLVDVDARAIEGKVQLSTDPNEAIHGLTLCPPRSERI
jgi:hypothetical protein